MALSKKKIGPYRLLEDIGAGGMGVVRRGVHEILNRPVAVKELVPGAAKDREAVERFRREALALAQLRHQNIVAVYDFFGKEDKFFMVLEYVDGPTLAGLIKNGPLPVDVATIIAARLASALDHAHFKRVIHRDIKPANVMVSKTGDVKLMDFGIAMDMTLSGLTRAGMAVGTPCYMAPEQLLGEKADARTDIYALGVLMYECLTGKRPYDGKSPDAIYPLVREGRYPPLRTVNHKVPRELERIVARCMKPRPKDRYQYAAELRRDLQIFLVERVKIGHSARLVGWLRAAGRITESEALTCLNAADLVETSNLDFEGPSSLWRWAAALMAAGLGGGTVWAFLTRPPWWLYLVGR